MNRFLLSEKPIRVNNKVFFFGSNRSVTPKEEPFWYQVIEPHKLVKIHGVMIKFTYKNILYGASEPGATLIFPDNTTHWRPNSFFDAHEEFSKPINKPKRMKRDTTVGRALKEGESFSIFVLTTLKQILPTCSFIDKAFLEQDKGVETWWKFSIKDRVDCVHFLLALQLADVDPEHFYNTAGELALQPGDLLLFLKERNLIHMMDGNKYYVHEVGKDKLPEDIFGFGDTLFEAIVQFFKNGITQVKEDLTSK